MVASVHPAGPLFRKGMRKGDVLTAIRWPAGRQEKSELAARSAIIANLGLGYAGGFPVFPQRHRPASLPASARLAAVGDAFVGTKGEWAFWTPEGYYDASMNGYRLFGWQINRGVNRLPNFYRADQFYRELERPRVMERLLPAGSLARRGR